MRTYVHVNAYSPTRAGIHTAGGCVGNGLGLILRSYTTSTPRSRIYVYMYIQSVSTISNSPISPKIQGM